MWRTQTQEKKITEIKNSEGNDETKEILLFITQENWILSSLHKLKKEEKKKDT